jgi:hypothetical protein
MKTLFVTLMGTFFVFSTGQSQNNNSISSGLGIYVFPSNNQNKEQQDADEMACYRWAKEQTGYDPVNPTTYVAEEADASPDGSAVRGAAGGAAVGAAIGSISGNMGEGAAYGAIIGGLRGRGQRKAAAARESQQNQAAANAANAKIVDDYKRAFGLCMEQKGYAISK